MIDFFTRLLRPQKARKKDLARELAGPTASGVRQALGGHPAWNLTPGRLAAILRQAESGDEIAYLELAEEMEEKDPHYRAVLATRKLQVSSLSMSVDAFSDKPEDIEAADLCREVFPVLRPALFDILDAVGKGFSVSEIIWDLGRHWLPKEIKWRDPRWFGFEPITGEGPYLRGETGLLEPLAEAKFIVHRVRSKSGVAIRGGLARAAAWAWLFKNFDLKSWNIFCEVYGHPLRLGKYDSAASEQQKNILLRAVSEIGADRAAIIPDSMQVEFIDAKAQGNAQIFRELAEYLDMQISKLVLGQTGTTDTGSRVGTADAHERVRADIEQADAEALAATIQRDVFTPLVRFNFGPERKVPVFHLLREEPENLTALAENLAKLAPIAPNLVEVSVIRDKFGFPEPAKGAETIGRKDNADEVQLIEEVRNSGKKPERIEERQSAEAMPGDDWLEELTRENAWEPLMEPLVRQLEELGAKSRDYGEFLEGLERLAAGLDMKTLREALASAMFAAWQIAKDA